MTTTQAAKPATPKLDLSVKAAGLLSRTFVTPGMFFNKV
jgi:hypothetical protein